MISAVERRDYAALQQLEASTPGGAHAIVLGITGPPGAGKSTLVDQLISELRRHEQQVAVLAIDPSSPFSGGAVLGDRIRMQKHATDDGVYIRSLGSRGARGGMSRATRDILSVLKAHSFDWIIVETVGVGQSEFDIMELADTTAVVMVPEAGDTVQSLKAGLLEVADVFIVNKADREGAAQMQQTLRAMIQLGSMTSGANAGDHNAAHEMTKADTPEENGGQWSIPVLMSVATQGEGVGEILDEVRNHRAWGEQSISYAAKRKALRAYELRTYVADVLVEQFDQWLEQSPRHAKLVQEATAGQSHFHTIARALVEAWQKSAGSGDMSS